MTTIHQENDQEMEREEFASFESDIPCRNLVDDIRRTVGRLGTPLSSECCIYRVPKKLRKVNEAAYTPQVVSIGPLHYGKRTLKRMENQKLRYLKKFLRAVDTVVPLEKLVSYIKENEERIRQCYAETFDYLSSDRFVKMVLVDAAFIIEFFLRINMIKPVVDVYDFILDKPRPQSDIEQDLMLLENQLPFFILEGLYECAFEEYPINLPSFIDLTLKYFQDYNKQKKPFPDDDVKHFTDLLRYFELPSPPTGSPTRAGSPSQSCFSNCYKYRDKNEKAEHLYSATELNEAGIKFQVSQSKCLLDIKFTNGKLEMPCFKLYDETESFIRNLMALEQCHYPQDTRICDYIALMDYLINTVKDVELLTQKKIMVNWLGDHHTAATLVNKLGVQILFGENHYSDLIRKLKEYYEVPYHSWKATLRHEYFSTPWRGASTIAAIILLLLTAIQTVCSVIGL